MHGGASGMSGMLRILAGLLLCKLQLQSPVLAGAANAASPLSDSQGASLHIAHPLQAKHFAPAVQRQGMLQGRLRIFFCVQWDAQALVSFPVLSAAGASRTLQRIA